MKYRSKIILALFIVIFLTASAMAEGVSCASDNNADAWHDKKREIYVFKGDLRQTLPRHTVVLKFFKKKIRRRGCDAAFYEDSR